MNSKIILPALVLLCSLAFAQIAFAANETITMPHDQDVYWNKAVAYTAKKGEVLTITNVQPCLSDKSKECWKVEHTEHGPGIIRKEWVVKE
ncbi:DUF3316 domain-containing protein [Magnetovibrio blakemorei]|nr:DUF3316 domain-containing protein [Magnetovibrio blakemorei]